MPLDVLAFISPKPGKEKRVAEIISEVTERIRNEEPYTLSYNSFRTQGVEKGTVDFVVYAKFENEESLERRKELQHHHDIARWIKDEDLLRTPIRYMKLEPHGGFDR